MGIRAKVAYGCVKDWYQRYVFDTGPLGNVFNIQRVANIEPSWSQDSISLYEMFLC